MNFRRVFLWLLMAIVVAVSVAWLWPAPERVIQGKSERQWIAELKPHYDPEQELLWKSLGDDGIRMLVRKYQKSYWSAEYVWQRTYRRLSRILPNGVLRLFPSPAAIVTMGPRATLMSRLGSLNDPQGLGLSVAILALNDFDMGARLGARSYFQHGTLIDTPLTRMDPGEKARLLPKFLAGLQDPHWLVRNSSVAALRFFPEASSEVIPALSRALNDPQPEVQLAAAWILHGMASDPQTQRAAIVAVITVLKIPNDQIAWQAAEALGELGAEPELAVPALIAALDSPSALTAGTAFEALARFPRWPPGSRATVEKLLQHPNADMRQRAANVLGAPAARP